jgi:hypothetical protein
MGGRQIVLVSTEEFSVLNTGIFWWEAKTKSLFSQCVVEGTLTVYQMRKPKWGHKLLFPRLTISLSEIAGIHLR